MNRILTKNEIVKVVMDEVGLDRELSEAVFKALTGAMERTLARRGKIVLKNIGTLQTKLIPAKTMKLKYFDGTAPARYKVKFIQSKNLIIVDPPKEKKALKNL